MKFDGKCQQPEAIIARRRGNLDPCDINPGGWPPPLEFPFLSSLTLKFPTTTTSISFPQPQTTRPSSPPKTLLQPRNLHHTLPILANLLSSFLLCIPKFRTTGRGRASAASPPPPPRPLEEAGCSLPLFRPYVAKVPWHRGARAFLSQLFPRYGHYCGPNWSSGKDRGLNLWDRRPVDWLDFCCYCHDIGYDTHDQAKLLKADFAFLECLEKSRMATKGGAYAALLYRAMCIAGFRSILIPYRMHLVRLQSGPSIMDVLSNFVSKATPMGKTEAANRKNMI